jgi:hypothetical protein
VPVPVLRLFALAVIGCAPTAPPLTSLPLVIDAATGTILLVPQPA